MLPNKLLSNLLNKNHLPRRLLTVNGILLLSLWGSPVAADICRNRMADGTIMITNLCPKKSERLIKSRPESPNYANIYKYTDPTGSSLTVIPNPLTRPFS